MSIETLRIHPAAAEEAETAAEWYAKRSRRTAERFLDEFDRAVDQISRSPEHFPLHEFGTRRLIGDLED